MLPLQAERAYFIITSRVYRRRISELGRLFTNRVPFNVNQCSDQAVVSCCGFPQSLRAKREKLHDKLQPPFEPLFEAYELPVAASIRRGQVAELTS